MLTVRTSLRKEPRRRPTKKTGRGRKARKGEGKSESVLRGRL